MPATKKPRKKYRPRLVASNPIEYVLSGLRNVTPQEMTSVGIINHGALVALVTEAGNKDEWGYLNGAVNLALVLAEKGFGYEFWGELREAQLALANVGRRWLKWQKWQITELEERILGRALEIHDAQLALTVVKDIELGQREVYKRSSDPNRSHRVAASLELYQLKEAA